MYRNVYLTYVKKSFEVYTDYTHNITMFQYVEHGRIFHYLTLYSLDCKIIKSKILCMYTEEWWVLHNSNFCISNSLLKKNTVV